MNYRHTENSPGNENRLFQLSRQASPVGMIKYTVTSQHAQLLTYRGDILASEGCVHSHLPYILYIAQSQRA